MILGNAGVLQMPIKRDKKKRKENKKSNSVKSLLFYASVSWAKQEHFLFSHVLRSSILISSGSVQFLKATFTFVKLSFCNNPSSPIFLTYFFLVGVCQIPKNQCKKRTWRHVWTYPPLWFVCWMISETLPFGAHVTKYKWGKNSMTIRSLSTVNYFL